MKHTLTFISLLIVGILSAQSYQINGNVFDKENTPMIGATVVILDQDTTMIAFGITDHYGNYEIYDVPEGNKILQVSYTGYTDHSQAIHLEGENGKINLGQTVLEVSSKILEEVSIKAEHIPMGILGDTINYNAAAFNTRPGASVEDLLKRLPGIEVARDGSIKAQGKDVQNVLVDGKEFFSGDVTLATKNLEAEAIEKVQVYDKKSEEAEFTGVDDGQEEKTINLKLKDGYKNGGFGKVAAEGGTEDTRQAKLNYNRFGPSIQASVIANSNNINKQAFSFNEYIDFMGGFQNAIAAGGFSQYGPGSQNGQGGSGITDQSSIGTNLNLGISEKVKMNGNYLFAKNNNTVNQTGTTQNYLSNNAFTTIDTSRSNSKTTNHRLNTKIKYNPNPLNAFTLNVKFFTLGNDNSSDASTLYLLESLATNSTSNNLSSNARSLSLASDILYKKKFLTKGRNLLSRAKYEHIIRDETTDIDNTITSISVDERILQLQEFNNLRTVATGSLDYTEPIGNKMYLGVGYSFRDEDQTPERIYFAKEGTKLNKLDDLSSLFNKSWTSHNIGLSIKRNRKKLKLDFGINYTHADLIATERGEILNQNQKYNYLLPSGSAKFTLKGGKSLDIDYFTNVTSPSLAQMVTQVNNLNPNTIILGNPNLNPEYIHTFSFGYNHFDSFNFSSLFWNLRASLSPNKIVNSRTINEDLVTEILPINAQNHQSYTGYFNHSSPIRKLKIKYSVESRLSYSRYKTLINAEQSDVSSAVGAFGLSIENRNKDIFDIKGGANIDLSAYSNDFNSNFDNPFLNYSLYLDGFIDFGKGWHVGSKFDYLTYNGGLFAEDQVQQLWNASLSKSFLTNKLMIKVTAHDMLNQNNGINRSGGINTLSDSRFNTLGRYVMVGVSYRLGLTKSDGIDIH
ncbi:MAG: hypothetical protein ACI9P5_000891 [Saprospiraceae bacterium]|jgi:hypothetical protein